MARNQPKSRNRVKDSHAKVRRKAKERPASLSPTDRVVKQRVIGYRQAKQRDQASQQLLLAITRVQALFIGEEQPSVVFGLLLQELLTLTDSEYGFIGEVDRTPEGQPFLRAHAITDIAWNEDTKALMAQQAPTLVFRNLKTLFGHVMTTGKPVISNDPAHDPRAGGLPPGHPPMHAFLGVPFYRRELMTGMVGVANRPGGYDEALVAYVEPFLSTCAQLLEGYHNRRLRAEAEVALRSSEERWQLAVQGSSDGIWDWNLINNEVYFSLRWKEMLGYSDHEILGDYQEWESRLHPEDRERVIAELTAYLEARIPQYHVEFRLRKKNGEYCWVQARGKAMWGAEGRPYRMAGSHTEITERKREEALQEAEKQALELVAKGAGLSEVLTFICRTIEEHTTPMRTSIMLVTEDGQHLRCIAAPSLPEDYNRAVDGIPIGPTVGSCGSAAYYGKPAIVVDIENDPLWKDYCHVTRMHGLRACWSQPILSSTGTVLGTFAAYYNEPRTPSLADLMVVERAGHLAAVAIQHSKMSEALRESEARFQAFMTHSPAVSFIKDSAGRHLYINPTFERLFGVSLSEIQGKTLEGRLPPEVLAQLQANDEKVLTSGETIEVEETVSTPDGKSQHWLVLKFPLTSSSGERLLGGKAIDITARKRAEEEQRRIRMLLTNVINATPDLVFVKDCNLRTVLCNHVFAQALGKEPADLIGHTDLENGWTPELVHGNPDRGIRGFEQDDRAALSGQIVHNANDPVNVNSAIRIFDTYKVPLRDEQGAIAGVLGIARDVTERKWMEDALHALVRGTGSVTGEAFFSVFAKELARALHMKYAAVTDVRSDQPDIAIVRAIWSGISIGQPFTYSLAGTPCEVAIREGLVCYPSDVQSLFPSDPDLVELQAESYLGILLRSQSGQALGHIFAIDDKPLADPTQATAILQIFASRAAAELERLRTDEALRESEERFRVLADTAPVLIWMSGLDKRAIYFNSRWLDYTGRTLDQELGDGWAEGVHPDDFDRCLTSYSDAFERREPFELEYRLRKANGQYGWLHESGAPRFLPGGTFAGYHGACIDITARKQAEAAREALQYAVDHGMEGFALLDNMGRYAYMNEAHAKIYGFKVSELIGQSWKTLYAEDQIAQIEATAFPALQADGTWHGELIGRMHSGACVHVEIGLQRLPQSAVLPEAFLCTCRDITIRKQTEAALRRAHEELEQRVVERTTELATANRSLQDEITERKRVESRLQTTQYAVDHAADQIFVIGPNGSFLDVNESACSRLGYTKEELLRMSVMDIDPDFPREVWGEFWAEFTRVGQFRLETRHRSKSGEVYPVEVMANYLCHDGRELDYAIVRDISERKRAEEAVRDSELRYKLVTEATFDSIAIHDQGVLLEVNAGLERMFGYESGELVGRSMWDLIADESRDQVLANMENGVSGPYEAMGRRKDGTTFPGEVVVRPYLYRGKEVRLVAGRDITERKHLETERLRHTEELERQVIERTAEIAKLESQRAQTERLAAMGRLAAGVAHEINNPIAGIKNAFTLVKQAVDPTHAHYEFVGMVDREITRVSSIVQNMYQLYRRESGKTETVNLQTMIGDIEALFAKQLQQRQLTLVVEAAPGFDKLDVPRSDLLQVLLNLLNNAIDCSQERTTITMAIREEAELIQISVRDQGAGIPPEVLPHIFEPFFTTKTGGVQKGMGLGLSISQSLVTAMGGRIDVHTQLGHGSTFSILLPRHRVVAHMPDQTHTIKEVTTHGYRNPTGAPGR